MTETELLDGIIAREGRAYTDRPADRGGPTKYGITQATLSGFLGRPASADDVRALDEPTARTVYRAVFLHRWDWVTDEATRVILTDWTITSNPYAVARGLQAAAGAFVDGDLGDKTRGAVATALATDPEGLRARLRHARADYYVLLALDGEARWFMQQHPASQLHNLRGWVARATTV